MILKNKSFQRKFQSTCKDIKFPQASTSYSAGYDIFSPIDFKLQAGEEIEFDTNLIYCTTEEDDVLMIYPRSGLGFKNYLRLANTVGVVDADYEGTIKMKLRNEGKEELEVKKGQAVAQCIIQKYLRLSPDVRENTERGTGGFGSTDK